MKGLVSWLSVVCTSVLEPAGVSFFHPLSEAESLKPLLEPGQETFTNRQVRLDNLLVTESIYSRVWK